MRLPPLSQIRQHDTCRLLPSRFADAEDSVLAPLADSPDHLADLFALDNATNQRLAAERGLRSEEHTSELQSLMRISYAVFCLKKKKPTIHNKLTPPHHATKTKLL